MKGMDVRRGAAIGAAVVAAAGFAYALERAGARRWRVGDDELSAAGRSQPSDVRHHFVAMSDGGRVHVLERGEGPTTVLVHGVTLGVAVWAPQLHHLPGRVIAISQRGHGQSRAGTEGYAFDRLGRDLLEVLEALDVRGAVLAGHSMGGMVSQLLAVERPAELARHVDRLVLVATCAGPIAVGPLSAAFTAAAARSLAGAERRGRGPIPAGLTLWAARASFGVHPSAVDVELTRRMLAEMSPSAMAGLLPPLMNFDVRDRLGTVSLPTRVVGGTRDLLTPPRTVRAIASRIPGADLTLLAGCGHMVMLERPDQLCDLLG
jgi:pimeloyl-ACP methyl ester carboxylesterase